MIKTFASSLAAVLTIGSICASGDAAAGGLQRGVIRAPVHGAILKPNFGAFNRAHRHGRFFGYGVPLIGYPYDDPVIYAGGDNPPVVPGNYEPVQRVCRTFIYNVRAEAGGRRDVSVTRCFVEPEPGPILEK